MDSELIRFNGAEVAGQTEYKSEGVEPQRKPKILTARDIAPEVYEQLVRGSLSTIVSEVTYMGGTLRLDVPENARALGAVAYYDIEDAIITDYGIYSPTRFVLMGNRAVNGTHFQGELGRYPSVNSWRSFITSGLLELYKPLESGISGHVDFVDAPRESRHEGKVPQLTFIQSIDLLKGVGVGIQEFFGDIGNGPSLDDLLVRKRYGSLNPKPKKFEPKEDLLLKIEHYKKNKEDIKIPRTDPETGRR